MSTIVCIDACTTPARGYVSMLERRAWSGSAPGAPFAPMDVVEKNNISFDSDLVVCNPTTDGGCTLRALTKFSLNHQLV